MFLSKIAVSLLVRLWVEMSCSGSLSPLAFVSLLVRLWVEMFCGSCPFLKRVVSLLVRLWVEISHRSTTRQKQSVSLLVRLWVEILIYGGSSLLRQRQPPCEAVSWNNYAQAVQFRLRMSASLWGCELKCNLAARFNKLLQSASLWGCELKW